MGSAPAHGQFLVDRESPLFTAVYRDAGTWLVHETAPSLDHSAWQELRSHPREASVSPQLDAPRVPPTNAHLVTNHTRLVGIECLGLCSARLGPWCCAAWQASGDVMCEWYRALWSLLMTWRGRSSWWVGCTHRSGLRGVRIPAPSKLRTSRRDRRRPVPLESERAQRPAVQC
jgi:hypothetical protein